MKIREVPGGADTNNAEIAAVIARASVDGGGGSLRWRLIGSKLLPEEDFPYIRHIYELFDADDDAESVYISYRANITTVRTA